MNNVFYSTLPGITAFTIGVILFLRIKKNNILGVRDFFWHYAIAFFIIATASIPRLLMHLGVIISYNNLNIIYTFYLIILLIAYLLFFRGTALFFSKDNFFPKILPLFIIPSAAIFSLIILLFLDFSTIVIYTAMAWGFLFVNNNILGSIFLYSFITGYPIKNIKRKCCALLLSLGWFSVLGLDAILWITAVSYDPEFWILKIISIKWWFIARTIVYLIILTGVLLSSKYLQHPKIER